MRLIAELKRRNVIRMAGLYLVGAWLVVQVAGTVLPMFGAPDWIGRSVVLLVAIGFVPALVFAWVFELTPEGIKRDDAVNPTAIAPQTAQRMNRMIVAVLVLALTYFGFDKFVLAPRREAAIVASVEKHDAAIDAAKPGVAATDQSIAVLPFVNMSSDKEQEYFSDGLAEELLNELAQIPQLRVIARTSSFSFKGKDVDVATIAKVLNVANVLEGSVRKSGHNLRITAQLIRSSDSSHLWSKTYDRDLTDVFKVQDEIAGEVVAALKLTLLPGRTSAGLGRTSNIEAYNHYLRGRQFSSLASADSYRLAIPEYEQAIALDPEYTSAYANLALAQAFVADLTADPARQNLALQAVEKAIALSPNDPEARATRGWIRSLFLWDWDGARSDFEAALSVDPNNATALAHQSWLLAAFGQLPQAIAAVEKAIALDPVDDQAPTYLGVYLNGTGQYGRAREVLERRLKSSGHDDIASLELGESLVLAGNPADALAAAREFDAGPRLMTTALAEFSLGRPQASAAALDTLKRDYASGYAYQIALVHAWRGEKEQAFGWLDRAYSQRDGGIAFIKYDPFLRPLQGDPRYAALVRKLGLPQ